MSSGTAISSSIAPGDVAVQVRYPAGTAPRAVGSAHHRRPTSRSPRTRAVGEDRGDALGVLLDLRSAVDNFRPGSGSRNER